MAHGTYKHGEFNDKRQKLVESFRAAANITKVCPPATTIQFDAWAFDQHHAD
jgi:hypothetical protein